MADVYIIFGGFALILYGLIVNGVTSWQESLPVGSKERKRADKIWWGVMLVFIIPALACILFVIGWIWYYPCGGGMLFETDSFGFFDGIIWGVMSLVMLAFVLGLVAICFGWNPPK